MALGMTFYMVNCLQRGISNVPNIEFVNVLVYCIYMSMKADLSLN